MILISLSYFNPRPPWGGRPVCSPFTKNHKDISIHALRGEGDRAKPYWTIRIYISIHALRGEGDAYATICYYRIKNFNPRPPWGGRLCLLIPGFPLSSISIHALRGEGDGAQVCAQAPFRYFNPRPPWGGRRYCFFSSIGLLRYFNPRPPWGGRLYCRTLVRFRLLISIHALRGEGDEMVSTFFRDLDISIHALRGEGDNFVRNLPINLTISIHALRGEGDKL